MDVQAERAPGALGRLRGDSPGTAVPLYPWWLCPPVLTRRWLVVRRLGSSWRWVPGSPLLFTTQRRTVNGCNSGWDCARYA
jgi:hypothetical protein